MKRLCRKDEAERKITMNPQMLLTVAVLLACALPPVARAGSLSTEVTAMFPQNASEVAYVDLHQARQLNWFPTDPGANASRAISAVRAISCVGRRGPDSQVDELTWALVPTDLQAGAAQNTAVPASEEVVGIALGSFWPEKAEAYFQAKKLAVAKVRDYSLYAFDGSCLLEP
jgi:hypothetical protein